MSLFVKETVRCWEESILSRYVEHRLFTEEEVLFEINKVGKGYEVIFIKRFFEEIRRVAEEKKKKHLFRFLGLKAVFISEWSGRYRVFASRGEEDVCAIHHALAVAFFELCREKYEEIEKKKRQKREKRNEKKAGDVTQQKKRIRSELKKMIEEKQVLGIRQSQVSHVEGVGFRAQVKCFLRVSGEDLFPLDITSVTPEEVIRGLRDYVRCHK